MPLALKKYGRSNAETLKKAFLESIIPRRKTPVAGVPVFAPPEHAFAGQNLRAPGTLMQWVGGRSILLAEEMQTVDPKLPHAEDSPLAK